MFDTLPVRVEFVEENVAQGTGFTTGNSDTFVSIIQSVSQIYTSSTTDAIMTLTI